VSTMRKDLWQAAELQQAQMPVRVPQWTMLSLQTGVPNKLPLWKDQTKCSLWKREECPHRLLGTLPVGVTCQVYTGQLFNPLLIA